MPLRPTACTALFIDELLRGLPMEAGDLTDQIQIYNFQVTTRDIEGLTDARGDSIKSMLESDYAVSVEKVRVILGYQVKSNISENDAKQAIYDLFADPVIEYGELGNSIFDNKNLFPITPQIAITVGFKPGVTDNAGQAGLDGLQTIFPNISKSSQIATTITYLFCGVSGEISPAWLSSKLHNQMIERSSISSNEECINSLWPSLEFPEKPQLTQKPAATVNLEVSDEKLIQISETGLLALNLEEMKAIQSNYRDPKVRIARLELGLPEKAPTDAELECLAQTWSEHCCHLSLIHICRCRRAI